MDNEIFQTRTLVTFPFLRSLVHPSPSNTAESFNAWTKEKKGFPIIPCIDWISSKMVNLATVGCLEGAQMTSAMYAKQEAKLQRITDLF